MKKLIVESIKYFGVKGRTPLPKDYEFVLGKDSLLNLQNRNISFFFDYEEDNKVKSDKLNFVIINSRNEKEIKDFIVQEITNYLN